MTDTKSSKNSIFKQLTFVTILSGLMMIAYAFSGIFAFFMGIVSTCSYIYMNLDEIKKTRTAQKLSLWWDLRNIQKKSKSLNQAQCMMIKYLFDVPIADNETELKTFRDVQNHFNEEFPFMIEVKNTRAKKIDVRGKDCKCISSYSYLDLGRDERVQDAAIQAANEYSTGNHGPRMLCGNLVILEDLEKKLAGFLKKIMHLFSHLDF